MNTREPGPAAYLTLAFLWTLLCTLALVVG